MKIYDWKTFLGAIIICGGVIAYKIISFDDIFDLLWIALFAYLLFQGLKISLTKDGYETEQKRVEEAKKSRRKMVDKYGKLVYVLLYSPFIILGLGAVVSLILAFATSYKTSAAIIFLIACIIYIILVFTVRAILNRIETE